MKRIAIVGNCQAQRIGQYISEMNDDCLCEFMSATPLVAPVPSEAEAAKILQSSDLLVLQPLGIKHAYLSEQALRAQFDPSKIISFAYFFNSGYAEMILVPSKGLVFGEEYVVNLLKSGESPEQIRDKYREGEIDFGLIERFEHCMQEMEKKEDSCNIRMVDYIRSAYQHERLFLTQNHPTIPVFVEYLRQIEALGHIRWKKSYDMMSDTGMSQSTSPISPMCKKILGYRFDVDARWYELGIKLLNHIIARFQAQQQTV
ncbi:MAG: hypothetical protein JXX14_02515 [Deltaproteobacteria bacterium]|nr:hypothetical protein [Deltaproteobacteria bacterium]